MGPALRVGFVAVGALALVRLLVGGIDAVFQPPFSLVGTLVLGTAAGWLWQLWRRR